jgi:hypothetical protein
MNAKTVCRPPFVNFVGLVVRSPGLHGRRFIVLLYRRRVGRPAVAIPQAIQCLLEELESVAGKEGQ